MNIFSMKKSKSKHEYKRQIEIAQSSVTWMDQLGIDYTGTRAEDLKKMVSPLNNGRNSLNMLDIMG